MARKKARIVGARRAPRASVPFRDAALGCRNECRHFDPITEAPLYVLHRAAGPLQDRNAAAFNLIQTALFRDVKDLYLAPREYEAARQLLVTVMKLVVGDLPDEVGHAFRRACPDLARIGPDRGTACPIVTPRTRAIGSQVDSRVRT